MPQPEQTPRPVTPGDPLTASMWNQLRDAVSRLSSFDGQQGAIVNGAGVFVKKSPPNKGIFKLNEVLTRTTAAAEAELMQWDEATLAFVGTGDLYDLSGKLWRGYGFVGSLVEAEYHLPSGLWLARGRGDTNAYATLAGNLSNGGSATATLFGGADTFTAWEIYGISADILAGVKIGAFWDEYMQKWIAHVATCNP